ncbi:MAG TPA: VOC family protein [Jiangellaceae bacterium]|nr:VOC family protein [Jiangellaceae bacterium]
MIDRLTRVIWFELWVPDLDRAKAFYGELFGWTFEPMTEYDPDWLIDAGDGRGTIGALWPAQAAPSGAGAVVYVAVANLPDSITTAEELGASLVREPTDIGDGTSFAWIRDPGGNLLGLWSLGVVGA